jgi:hypothetical protein
LHRLPLFRPSLRKSIDGPGPYTMREQRSDPSEFIE